MRSFRWVPVAGWAAATAASVVLGSAAILPVLRTTAPDDGAARGRRDDHPAGHGDPGRHPADEDR